jgi:hypothetical protein
MLEQVNALLVIYPAGASGEFLSAAMSESFPCISKSTWNWEDHNRCKFFDLFDRHLNSGFSTITEKCMLSGIEKYMSQCDNPFLLHIGMCHPNPYSLKFVSENLPFIPVLEIVTFNKKSKKFRFEAANQKIKNKSICFSTVEKYNSCNYQTNNHLKIEWSDLFLDDVENQFKKIEKFIGHNGNVKKFKILVNDYLTRNVSTISLLNEQSI